MIRSTADRHGDGVGVITDAAFTPARHTTTASKHPHLVLRAHGGHAYSRIPISTTASRGDQCDRARITVLRGSTDTIDASLAGVRLRICARSEYKILSLERPGSSSSTRHR